MNKSEFPNSNQSENRKSYIENLEAGDEPVEENEFQKYSKESFKALLNKFDQKNTSNNLMVSVFAVSNMGDIGVSMLVTKIWIS